MIQTINFNDFQNAFNEYNGKENFSYEGLKILFYYLEGLEETLGEQIELDVIEICCDYCEELIEEVIENYSLDVEDCKDQEELVLEYLSSETIVCGSTSDSVVYFQF